MAISIEKIAYKGWLNCYRVSNGIIDLIATGDVGPRIIRLGYIGEKNEFAEFDEQLGTTDSKEWLIFGGHRLWHSPEAKPRCYWPDSVSIEVEEIPNGLVLKQPTEGGTGMTKTITVTMCPESPKVTVVHKIKNDGLWPVELAAWSLSVMAPGGTAVVPQPTGNADEEGLLPNRVMTLWPYTDMTDKRFYWGRKYIFLRQDAKADGPAKIGISNTAGWGVYQNGDTCFLKAFDVEEDALYPDGGATMEVYTNNRMLELESLSPLVLLDPGDDVEHTETWELLKGIPAPASEEIVDDSIASRL